MHVNRIGVRELARQTGVSASTISRINQGEDCQVSTFVPLLTWLMEPEDETNGGSDHENQRIESSDC